jgi:hypothetical protein
MRAWVLALAPLLAQEGVPPVPKFAPPAPVQPLPYSHKTHAGTLKIECTQCHTMPDTGEFATIPETKKCMTCHVAVKKESPHIQKLAEFHSSGKEVPWKRVYKIPDYVYFSHKIHVEKGASCDTCHGPVAEREVLRKERDITMGACMDCHRARQASNQCNFCHEQR